MLTPELVRARVVKGELQLSKLSPKLLERAREIAQEYLSIARNNVGKMRDELKQHWDVVPVSPGERRLADGLLKLVEDASNFDSDIELSPVDLRREVFLQASSRRSAATHNQPFEREDLLRSIAEKYEVSTAQLEAALYADLRGAQRLQSVAELDCEELLRRYQIGQVQAVLLRAVEVTAEVRCDSPLAYRQLFNKLKFRRLLYRIEPWQGGYSIKLDGPFSLFESVTKYGMQLALMLPALLECNQLKIQAKLCWGKQRKQVTFSFQHKGQGASRAQTLLTDDVQRLLSQLNAKRTGWQIAVCSEILNLPGLGVCVPDLVFERPDATVYLEALGYWSRDAVWRRVEMASRGLSAKVLFAVSSRLRVSESVLEESDSGALYVYKGVMSPPQVLKRVEALAHT